MAFSFIIGASQQKRRHVLSFETLVAPLDFDINAQPVNIYDIFEIYYNVNRNARYIYSYANTNTPLTLTPSSSASFRYGYQSGGINYVVDVPLNGSPVTIFNETTTTHRWVIVNNTFSSGTCILPLASNWLYIGNYTVTALSCGSYYCQCKYIHCDNVDNVTFKHRAFLYAYLTGICHIYKNVEGDTNFYGTSLITSFNIHEGVTSLPQYFAYSSSGLTGDLTFPDSCTSVGANAFYNCTKLTGSLDLGDGMQNIGVSAFLLCPFTGTLTIPPTQLSIGEGAFGNGNFSDIVSNTTKFNVTASGGDTKVLYDVSDGIKVEANYAARNVSGTVIFRTDTTKILAYCCYNNTLKTGTFPTFPTGTTYLGDYAFYNCYGFTGEIKINAGCYTTNGNYIFYNCNKVTSLVTESNSVGVVGSYMFYNMTSLTSVTLGEGITDFGGRCFQNSPKSGTSITLVLPSTTRRLNYPAFTSCLFTGITLNEGLEVIGDATFYYSSSFTGNLYIPSTVTSIVGTGAIGHGSWTSITGGSTNYPVSDNVVYDTKTSGQVKVIGAAGGYVGGLTLRADTTSIESMLYRYAPFQNRTGVITIPQTVTNISGSQFMNAVGITGLVFAGTPTISTIGASAFYNCSGLIGTLTLPASLTSVGDRAFSGDIVSYRPSFTQCNSLKNTAPTVSTNTFAFQSGGVTAAIPLHVLTGTTSYTTAPWTTTTIFSSIIKDL